MDQINLKNFDLRNLPEFRFLQSISLERSFYEGAVLPYTLRLQISKEIDEFSDRIVIEFSRVRNIRWGDLTSGAGLLLQIRDVSKNQLEGIRFRVTDEEENIVSFYCYDFEILQSQNISKTTRFREDD